MALLLNDDQPKDTLFGKIYNGVWFMRLYSYMALAQMIYGISLASLVWPDRYFPSGKTSRKLPLSVFAAKNCQILAIVDCPLIGVDVL